MVGTGNMVVNLGAHEMRIEQNNVYQSPLNGTDLLVNHRNQKRRAPVYFKPDHEFLSKETKQRDFGIGT